MGLIQTYIPWVEKPNDLILNDAAIPHRENLIGLWVSKGAETLVNLAQPGVGDLFALSGAPTPVVAGNEEAEVEHNYLGAVRTGTLPHNIADGQFTLIARVAPQVASPTAGYFGFGVRTPNFYTRLTPTGPQEWGIYRGGYLAAGSILNQFQWYTLGISRESESTNAFKFYLDGAADGNTSLNYTITSPDIAWGGANAGQDADQNMSWIALYEGVAFTAEEHAKFADPTYFYQTFFQPLRRLIPVGIATTPTPGVTATLSARPGGGLPDTDEAEVRSGAVRWEIALTGAQWTSSRLSGTQKRDVINGLQDTSSAANDAQFQKVRDIMLGNPDFYILDAAVDAPLPINLPVTPDYDISDPGSILAVIPSSAYVPDP